MGRNPAALSAVQIAVLRGIADGCHATGDDGEGARRISARSLHRRGLVRVRGSGSTWTAAVSTAGRAWLDAHPVAASGPDGPEGLVRRVVDAGGALDVGADVVAKVRYEEEVRASLHSPDRPRGWKLEVKNAGSWSDPRYQVVLVRHFDDLVDLVPVPVPARVARYHPAVKAYLADRDRQLVSREHLERAARVLHALADEAPRRSISVQAPGRAARPANDWDARTRARAHLVLEAPSGTYGIRVRELSAAGGAPIPPRDYRRRSTRAAWLESRDREFVGTGQLEIIVEGPGMAYSGTRLADSKTATLESKLPRLFRAIEIERLVAEHREHEREREAAERRRRWEAAMAEARRRYEKQARWDAFVQRSRDWDAVRRHREFIAVAREAARHMEPGARAAVEAHLDFAERRVDELDPLANPAALLPTVPEARPDDLKPFLDGWSPHGPDGRGW